MHSQATLGSCVQERHAKHFFRRERTMWAVVALTLATMVLEFGVGAVTHSLALTTEGWHMATHAGVLGFSGLAYRYARTHANNTQFAFGTGKVYALAGYTNAVVLLLVALLLAVTATRRIIHPEIIGFDEALPVAIIGVLANAASLVLLGKEHNHEHEHEHPRDHLSRGNHDHNLRAAYLHVIADLLTGILAIVALVGGRWLGLRVLDPIVGFVGAGAIAYWGWRLLCASARQLLDAVPLSAATVAIRARLEAMGDTKVQDLRLWHLGPSQLGCVVSLSASTPERLEVYRSAVLHTAPVTHLTIEVRARA
jgi:cation diffusion facilitator family transporter